LEIENVICRAYDSKGKKLAEAMTAEGAAVELRLPKRGTPNYVKRASAPPFMLR
jgi:hypothetical protein